MLEEVLTEARICRFCSLAPLPFCSMLSKVRFDVASAFILGVQCLFSLAGLYPLNCEPKETLVAATRN